MPYVVCTVPAEDDRRATPRRRVLKGAVIAYNERHCTLACTVRDISDTGARLRLTGAVTAPDTFELIIDLDGLEAPCEVIRREGNDIGVRFLSPPRRATPKRSQIVDPVIRPTAATLRKKPTA